MNEELLAVSALIVQCGALLVSHNCFINFFAIVNVKPTQVCSAPSARRWRFLKGNYELNYAFEKADRLLEHKRTGSQFHNMAPLTLQANLCWHLPEENSFNPKFQNHPPASPI
jgi:hypothetical protein